MSCLFQISLLISWYIDPLKMRLFFLIKFKMFGNELLNIWKHFLGFMIKEIGMYVFVLSDNTFWFRFFLFHDSQWKTCVSALSVYSEATFKDEFHKTD